MKRVVVAGVFFLANVAVPAMADCTAFGGSMTATAILNLLTPGNTFPSNVYACYTNAGKRTNNEHIVTHGPAGQVWDFKKGPTDPVDPSVQVGTYTGGTDANGGTISYAYGGTTYIYEICNTPTGSTYQFYNTGSSANLSVVVSTSTSGC